MGAQMMAPDYAWWRGFYECKHRFVEFLHESRKLLESGKPAYKYPNFPGAGGSTRKPPELFGKQWCRRIGKAWGSGGLRPAEDDALGA
jgi:hypothetical protein